MVIASASDGDIYVVILKRSANGQPLRKQHITEGPVPIEGILNPEPHIKRAVRKTGAAVGPRKTRERRRRYSRMRRIISRRSPQSMTYCLR